MLQWPQTCCYIWRSCLCFFKSQTSMSLMLKMFSWQQLTTCWNWISEFLNFFIKNFNPDPVIHLWQQAAIWGWRPNQKIWKKTKQSRHSGVTESDSDATSDISENCESDSKYSSDESSISPPAVESDQWCNARYQYIKWDWTAFG